ncbi:hypothetical protein FSP39_006056, partial [Pinctada imbricata]
IHMERLHHVEFAVNNGELYLNRFKSQYGFDLIASRSCRHKKQWVVQSGKAIFLLTEFYPVDLQSHVQEAYATHYQDVLSSDPYFSPNTENDIYSNKLETAFNVALKVQNVRQTLETAVKGGAVVLREPSVIKDERGAIELAVIKSCIGNVVHTLIDDKQYNGVFLPLFNEHCSCKNIESQNFIVSHMDHIAFVCSRGSTSSILKWYENCFKMHRFFINSDENAEEGFMIKDTGIGLRMKAMEYWHCSETGLKSCNAEKESDGVKFVLVESLEGQGLNQVDVFLGDHNGPGVQHIGLYTNNIIEAVSLLESWTEIEEVGIDVDILKENGILLDTEADPGVTSDSDRESDTSDNPRYLMQKFTKPLFSKRTFFLELIERVGARGFGAGNITALWRAVQAYMTQGDK